MFEMEIARSEMPSTSTHYDASYFQWQRVTGEFGGWANVDKFRKTIAPGDHVLDFGCGGGFLLPNLDCSKRYGIEPNAAARETAQRNGVTVFELADAALQALGPAALNVVISDNALEHALEPWREQVSSSTSQEGRKNSCRRSLREHRLAIQT